MKHGKKKEKEKKDETLKASKKQGVWIASRKGI